MPIVTITTSNRLTGDHGRVRTTWHIELGEAIPQMFFEHKEALHLDPDTPVEATQVDFDEFSIRAVNAPDIWIMIQLTEVLPDHKMREVREAIQSLIKVWFERLSAGPPNLAVDIAWTPGHGFLQFGAIRHQW